MIGSLILTDRCNLSCRHCVVGNVTSEIYPYDQIRSGMQRMYDQGVRILLLYGGEPFLWQDQDRTLSDLVREAKQMGYLLVNVVTNGTYPLELPEVDMILVSLDGDRMHHIQIRGDTYDLILENINQADSDKICLYMAINRLNQSDIEAVCTLTRSMAKVKAISFNFHTPYPGTEHLSLSRAEKQACCERIVKLMDAGYPILNLRHAFPSIVGNTFPTPCYQCVMMEKDRQWICGRCRDVPGLCDSCGYFFAAEFSLLFRLKFMVVWDFIKTYGKLAS